MNDSIPAAKRHRANPTPWSEPPPFASGAQLNDLPKDFGCFLTDIFVPKHSESSSSHCHGNVEDSDNGRNHSKKRAISWADTEDQKPDELSGSDVSPPLESQNAFLFRYFPHMLPSVPSKEHRTSSFVMPDPFLEHSSDRHSQLRKKVSVSVDGKVNSYIKCTISWLQPQPQPHRSTQPVEIRNAARNGTRIRRNALQMAAQFPRQLSPMIPSAMSSNFELDAVDANLWRFYSSGFCNGRTLLKDTNFWITDLLRMAQTNECVRASIFALSATYVLDFNPDDLWRKRANKHYRRATDLLNSALTDPQSQTPGKEDAVIGAMVLLICEDIITWELRRPKNKSQRWVEGMQTAIHILDKSDPGYRYWEREHTQSTTARISCANLLASFEIIYLPVIPLHSKGSGSNYAWLLEGSEKDSLKIHGGTGVSPKLLHMLAQITRFTEQIAEKPDCVIIPMGGDIMRDKLVDFRQWSTESEGYPTAQALLDSCVLNDEGQVSKVGEVTDLTGQAWVSAAQIYLLCRFYRRPRSHPAVKKHLTILLQCVEMMPCTGTLFTSQSPFFPIFIMAVVSSEGSERLVAQKWFETVVGAAGCRSSVPPVWEVVKDLWTWIDANLIEDSCDFNGQISIRQAWWEQMVERLMRTCGPLSLC